MRLLEIGNNDEVSLTKDLISDDDVIPPYAILSHTWEDQEVTFDDLTDGTGKDKAGYDKIRFCAERAAQEGLSHCWVDTCCINKANPVELQDAINSMFRWYRDASECYVFLSDVSIAKRKADCESDSCTWEPAFRNSRWFTRGWTLQELLAPATVKFFSKERRYLGDRYELRQWIHEITNLPIPVLTGSKLLRDFGVEERLSWSYTRTTTRKEDKVYSLLGIFDIFMPLIYGEGQNSALRRLRKEIQEHRYSTLASVNLTDQAFDCLRSLSYPEQEHRYNDIHTAVETCEWLSQDPQYRAWMNSARGLFWIKGNPGSGKSVLMKHAVRTMIAQSPEELVESYFIHGQGSELQKTPVGVFRALLNSLLGHLPAGLARLTATFEERERRFGGYLAGRWSWSCKELQETLSDALINNTKERQVTIFVDALDECGEGPARTLLAYFGNLSTQLETCKANVKLCLSSRHYPVLGLDEFPTISVEERNRKDIQWYVSERLRDICPGTRRHQIEADILSKAQGSFQWVFLITGVLIDRILAGKTLVGHIASCPLSLSEMYATLLDSKTETDKHQMTKLFRWILFAERPLSAQELREALATDADMICTTVAELRSHEDWSETLADFERYVRCISKGLVEFHSREIWEQWEASDREAQLIHQSVADFLLEKYAIDTVQDSSGAGHFQISRSCLKYLTLEEVLNERRLPRDTLSSKFPLAPYAVRHVFEHIKKVEGAGLSQVDLLSAMKWSPASGIMRQFVELWNTLNPVNIGTPAGWPFNSSSEYHFLAAVGSTSALVASLTDNRNVIDGKDLDGNTPLHIAIAEGHHDIAFMLMRRSFKWRQHDQVRSDQGIDEVDSATSQEARPLDLDTANHEGDTVLDVALVMEADAVVAKLVDMGADLQRLSQPHLLSRHAIGKKDMKLLAKLVAGNLNLTGAVYFAVEIGSPDEIVLELLKAGGDTAKLITHEAHEPGEEDESEDDNPEDTGWDDALHCACRSGSTDTVNLLLSYGVPATTLDESGRCPLHIAAGRGHGRIVQSLLQYEPSAVEIEDNYGGTALTAALQNAHFSILADCLKIEGFSSPSTSLRKFFMEMFKTPEPSDVWALDDFKVAANRLLVIGKVDLTTKDALDRSIFWYAAAQGHETVVELLLTMEAVDPIAKDWHGVSPLLAAVRNGHTAVVKLLLLAIEKVVLDVTDENGQPALSFAVSHDDTAIVKMLNASGRLDIDLINGQGHSLFWLAVLYRRVELFGSPLHTGTELDPEALFSMLWYAAQLADKLVFERLLDIKYVNLEVTNSDGASLLSLAASTGNEAIMELLLDTGRVNVSHVDHAGMTPLQHAEQNGYTAIVWSLRAYKWKMQQRPRRSMMDVFCPSFTRLK